MYPEFIQLPSDLFKYLRIYSEMVYFHANLRCGRYLVKSSVLIRIYSHVNLFQLEF